MKISLIFIQIIFGLLMVKIQTSFLFWKTEWQGFDKRRIEQL